MDNKKVKIINNNKIKYIPNSKMYIILILKGNK